MSPCGVHGKTDNGYVIALGGFLDGVGDVGNWGSDDQGNLIHGHSGDVGVDSLSDVALGVVGVHHDLFAVDAAVGVDLIDGSLFALLDGQTQTGGVAGDVLQATDQNLAAVGSCCRGSSGGRGAGGSGAGSCAAASGQAQSHTDGHNKGYNAFHSVFSLILCWVSARGCGGRNVCGLCLLFSGVKAGKLGGLALPAPVFLLCCPVLILDCKRLQSKANINSDGVFRAFAVPPEILCPKYTPVAQICQYVLHIFVLLFKFGYANICKTTKIRRIAPRPLQKNERADR